VGRVHSVEEAPFWQGHVYGVVVGIGVEDVKNGIKRLYPRDTSIKRPLRVRECTDVPKALSYAVKPAFVRRVSYVDPRTGRDNTYNYDLKPPQLRELALCLGRYKFARSIRPHRLSGLQRSNKAEPRRTKALKGTGIGAKLLPELMRMRATSTGCANSRLSLRPSPRALCSRVLARARWPSPRIERGS
jgi:hypothetical protein